MSVPGAGGRRQGLGKLLQIGSLAPLARLALPAFFAHAFLEP
jgi:hypothetical protein